jgi:hypothetical protein
MKDVELRNRLMALGMSRAKADGITQQLRDVVHPVAATAAAKMRDHREALGMLAAYGDAGLSGYEYDEMSGLLKSVKKAVKKVGKTVGKVAKTAVKTVGKVAAVVAPVLPGPLAIAAVGTAVVGSKLAKKDKKKKAAKKLTAANQSIVASIQPGMLAVNNGSGARFTIVSASPAGIVIDMGGATRTVDPQEFVSQFSVMAAPQDGSAPASVGVTSADNLSQKIGTRKRVRVPRPVADTATAVASEAVQQGMPADTAALMQAMLANQGTNMVSPAAQSVVRDVADEGVQQTTAGPSSLPSWLLPALAVGFGAAILLPKGRGK